MAFEEMSGAFPRELRDAAYRAYGARHRRGPRPHPRQTIAGQRRPARYRGPGRTDGGSSTLVARPSHIQPLSFAFDGSRSSIQFVLHMPQR